MEALPGLVQRANDPLTGQAEKAQLLQHLDSFQHSPNAWSASCEFLKTHPNSDPAVSLFFLNCLEAVCASLVRFESVPSPHGRLFVRETLLGIIQTPSPLLLLQKKCCLILVMLGQREFASTWVDFAQHCTQHDLLLVAACENLPDCTKISLSKYRAEELAKYCNNVAGPTFVHALTVRGKFQLSEARFALTEWVPLQHLTFEFIQSVSDDDLGTLANILDRNYFPNQEPQAGQFLELITGKALAVLELGGSPEAVLGFLHPFTKRHFAKLQTSQTFPVQRFLELMFAFTFSLRTVQLFYSAVEVWELFIESCQDFELQRKVQSPLAAPVIAPLLVRLLEMFLYSKTSASPEFLQGLQNSYTLSRSDEEDDADGGAEECDLDVLVGKIMLLVQRTSFLPYSSALGLSGLLQNTFGNLGESASKLAATAGQDGAFAAHDCRVNLQIVATCAPSLFTRQTFAELAEIAKLAEWQVEIAKLVLGQALWQRGSQFVQLLAQAFVCIKAMMPWARLANGAHDQFVQSAAQVAIATLQTENLPEEPKLKAVQILQFVPNWTEHIPSLLDFSITFSDSVRGKLYAMFALSTVDVAEQLLVRSLAKDILAVSQGKDHERKRSLLALQSVLEITALKPETTVKKQIYQHVCLPVVPACLQILADYGKLPPSLLFRALDFLLASFKNLRKQLGDAGCTQIISQCMLVKSSPLRVFQLLQCVVDEPSNAFYSLLGSVLQLCQANLNATSNEVEEVACHVLFSMLLNDWKWLQGNLDAFKLVVELLVSRVGMDTPPDLVREVCQCLVASQVKNGLFAHAELKPTGFASQVFARCMALLQSKERDMICDDLLQVVYGLAKADLAFFIHQVVAPSGGFARLAGALNEQVLKDQGQFEDAVLGSL